MNTPAFKTACKLLGIPKNLTLEDLTSIAAGEFTNIEAHPENPTRSLLTAIALASLCIITSNQELLSSPQLSIEVGILLSFLTCLKLIEYLLKEEPIHALLRYRQEQTTLQVLGVLKQEPAKLKDPFAIIALLHIQNLLLGKDSTDTERALEEHSKDLDELILCLSPGPAHTATVLNLLLTVKNENTDSL